MRAAQRKREAREAFVTRDGNGMVRGPLAGSRASTACTPVAHVRTTASLVRRPSAYAVTA